MEKNDFIALYGKLSTPKRALARAIFEKKGIDFFSFPIVARPPDAKPLPLSFAQQRLWFLDQFEHGSAFYNLPAAVRLTGELDRAALTRTLNEIVRRHEVLRTRFATVDGAPVQVIAEQLELPLPVIDLITLPAAEREAKAHLLARDEARKPFDLSRGPLIRASLIRLEATDHLALFTLHHIVSDGWSTGVLVREIAVLYAAYLQNRPSPLPDLPIQYADFSCWQHQWLNGPALQRQIDYWTAQLRGCPALLTLPTDHARPAVQSHRGATLPFMIGRETTAGLHAIGKEARTTLFMTLTAAFSLLLSRYSGQNDICIGTSIANRNRTEIEGLIGFFVNTLVLRILLDGTTFSSLLQRVRATTLEAYAHQDLPFERLVEVLRPERSTSQAPLFQAMVVLQNAPTGTLTLPGLALQTLTIDGSIAKFDLTLHVTEAGEQLQAALEYSTDLFDQATVERMARHFGQLLESIVADPRARIRDLTMLGAEERRQLLDDADPTTQHRKEETIHQLFEAKAAQVPDVVAVSFEDQQLTYAELNARSNQLAHYLAAQGVGPETLVGLCVERSVEMVVGVLGILKAGGAYVPLDPGYPEERLRYMLDDAQPAVLLTEQHLTPALPTQTIPTVCIDTQWETIARYPTRNPSSSTRPNNLAYVIYTSGSTGKPKGALLQHSNVVRLFAATDAWFGFSTRDTWTLFHSIGFDFSVWEIWGALLHGGKLIVVPHLVARSPEQFHALLIRDKVTVLNQTPSAFRQLMEVDSRQPLPSSLGLCHVIFGAEALDCAGLTPWFDRHGYEVPQLINMYGITETTVHVTYHWLQRHTRNVACVGRRIPDLGVFLLDSDLNLVPVGVPGELYVSGDGLARGYLNRAALTAERFVPNPFAQTPGDRMYKSGDLARYLPDGNIEYLGRIDHQVKIRGFRVELGEIEAVLTASTEIGNAVVLVREDIPGDQRLVAYLTPREGQRLPDAATLRSILLQSLPDYMVPANFIELEQIPLTPHGKVDRRALPAPDTVRSDVGYVAPRTAAEGALARIWADVLKLDKVGVHDNFFALGGHSLLAVTLIERMHRAGCRVDVRTVFTTPTIAALAVAVGAEASPSDVVPNRIPEDTASITPAMVPLVQLAPNEIAGIVDAVPGGARNIQDIYPLTPLQEGILFHHLMSKGGDAYLLQSRLRFDSRERLESFLIALQRVIDRHDILRTAVLWDGVPEPVQVVWRQARIIIEEVSLDAEAGDIARQLDSRYGSRHYKLDVHTAPMLRAFVAEDAAHDCWLLQILAHHLVTDHATLELIIAEIGAILEAREHELPEALPFRKFVVQAKHGIPQAEHEAFFGQMLSHVSEPTAPFGLLDVRGDGNGIDEVKREVDPLLAKRLRQQVRSLGVSAASLVHLAWAQVLAGITNQRDVVFGTVLFGRMQSGEGADRVLGMFINTLPICISVGDESARESVKRVHQRLTQLLRHEHAPLALAQRCSGVKAPAPLFSTLLNYRHSARRRSGAGSGSHAWEGIELIGGEERTSYPVTLSVDDLGDGFGLTAQVVSSSESRSVCDYMHTALEHLVQALESAPRESRDHRPSTPGGTRRNRST